MTDLIALLERQYWQTNPGWCWLVPTEQHDGCCRYSFKLLPEQHAQLFTLGCIATDGKLTAAGLSLLDDRPAVKDSIERRRLSKILVSAD